MSYATFLADQTAVRDRGEFLVELYPKNASGVVTVIRVSRRGTAIGSSAITIGPDSIPAHVLYRKRLLKAPTLTQSIWSSGQILSSSLPSFGSGLFNNADGGLDQYQDWTFAGCNYKVFFCDSADVSNTIGKIADGIMGHPQFGLSTLEIPFLGRESLFDTPLSTHVYRGTGYMLELFGDRTVSYGAPAAVGITGSFTIEGWIWLDALPNTAVGYWAWIGGTGRPWGLIVNSNGTLRLDRMIGGVTESKTTTAALSVQKFYHFAFSVSGVVPTLYLWGDDAQTEIVETLSSYSSATANAVAGGATYALRSASNPTFRPWADEYRVWNVARTAGEIRADRFREIPSGSIPASLVHYTRFNDGTGTTVTDSSATGANGTISGAGTSTWLHSQEGGPELAGAPKPYCSGERFGCAPVLVDPVRQGYQVAGGGAIQDINSFEGGAPHTMVASSANFRTYLTTTPAAGTSLRFLPFALFKLGSAPTLPVSATVKGYNGGALGYVDKGSTVTRDVVTRRGPKLVDPTGLDTVAFDAYAAVTPGIIGYFEQVPDSKQVTIRSVLDQIMKSGAGYWGYNRASTLFTLKKFSGPNPSPVQHGTDVSYNAVTSRITSTAQINFLLYVPGQRITLGGQSSQPDDYRIIEVDPLGHYVKVSKVNSPALQTATDVGLDVTVEGTVQYNFQPKHIIRNSLQPINIESIIWKVVVRYRHNNVKLSEDQVAASIKSTANWQQWTMEWQEKEDHDDALLAQYPGLASTVLTIDTLLQYDVDAQALATYVLSVIKGKKIGWSLTVGATGLEATIDQTATVLMHHQDEVVRLGLDGADRYSTLTVEDNRQEGLVKFQIWGSEGA